MPDHNPIQVVLSFFLISYFLLRFFFMWTILKVFIEFVTILLLFYVLIFWPRGMWDLRSLTRDQTYTPCIGRQSLNPRPPGKSLSFSISIL